MVNGGPIGIRAVAVAAEGVILELMLAVAWSRWRTLWWPKLRLGTPYRWQPKFTMPTMIPLTIGIGT